MSAGFAIVIVIILLVLTALSAIFSAIETSLFSLQPFQIRRLKEQDAGLAETLEKLMHDPRRLLSGVLLGNAVVNLPLIILCVYLLNHIVSPSVHFWTEALIIFAVVVLLCDLIPKLIALSLPLRAARIGGIVFSRLMPIFDPLFHTFQNLSDAVANYLTPGRIRPPHILNAGELVTLVQLSAQEGAISSAETKLIQNIIKLGEKTVRDCMTPRVDAFTIPDDLTNEEALLQLKKKRYRRIPIYADTPDNILGVLDMKTFLTHMDQNYMESMIPPSFVPETMNALDLLRSFLTHQQGMAVIVDEYGGTEGFITLADLTEEIITEAISSAEYGLYIENLGGGRFIADGRARLEDLAECVGERFEDDGIDTVAGLIFNRMGYVPKPGTYFQIDDLSFTVRRTSRKRVEQVLVVAHRLGSEEGKP